jgi:selenocysteine-specific elongation factor
MHVIGTAGHVDHGKSSLVERLTGIDPDRFEEEKRRGLTIDLGFAWLTLPSGKEIGLVDVPGHERFIKNMLAGAGGISICLFVVAANEGWKPQSAEHLSILHVLGITSGVVALTKSDTVDQEALELVTLEVQEELSGSVLANAPIVACSSVSGQGIDRLVQELDRVVTSTSPLPDSGRPRLWVDRVFTISGAGTVVTGTLTGGSVDNGQEVEVSPAGRRGRVRRIQTHKREVPRAAPGTRVALNLAGLDRQGAERGNAIVAPGQWRPSRVVDAKLEVLPAQLTGAEHVLTEKGAHLLYVGSAETPVRVRLLDRDEIPPGGSGFARLFLRDRLPLARSDRFVLRDAGRVLTFGGGEIMDPRPTRRPDHRLLERLAGATSEEALAAFVQSDGAVPVEEAMVRSGATRSGAQGVTQLGSIFVSDARLRELVQTVERTLESYHQDRPLERGIAKEVLRARTPLDAQAFQALLERLPEVMEDGAVVHMGGHSATLLPEQQSARNLIIERIEAGGMSPPLTEELGADPALLRAMTEAGDLIRIGDFYLTAAQAAKVRSEVRADIELSGPLSVAQIRDLLRTSRKYAVPLCEWLDSTGATRRQGDLRYLGPRP